MKLLYFILLLLLLPVPLLLRSQDDKGQLAAHSLFPSAKDSIRPPDAKEQRAKKDSLNKKKHIPSVATFRSAVLPGWGQAYNKEYWKIPIVYGALAIPTYAFFYNNSFYNKTKFAYEAVFAATYPNHDSSQLAHIDASVKQPDGTPLSLADYQNYRNEFRRDRDYSVLWFVIVWGLNVLDATVFAHLKDFDVSNDFTMHIQPVFNSATRSPGIGLVMNIRDRPSADAPRRIFDPTR